MKPYYFLCKPAHHLILGGARMSDDLASVLNSFQHNKDAGVVWILSEKVPSYYNFDVMLDYPLKSKLSYEPDEGRHELPPGDR